MTNQRESTIIRLRFVVLAVTALALASPAARAQPLSLQLQSEGAVSLATAARESGSAVRGAILFPQRRLACANCHTPGDQDPIGPDLTLMASEVTDTYLVEAILAPSMTVKKGFEMVTVITESGKTYTGRVVSQTDQKVSLHDGSAERRITTLLRSEISEIVPSNKSSMPDDLVDQLKDRQQFLDLLKYVMEIKATRTGQEADHEVSSSSDDLSQQLRGLVLLDEFQCFACHRRAGDSPPPPKRAPNLAWGNGRIDPHFVEKFIENPLRVRPGTRMPDLLASLAGDERRAAARELTHYVVSLGDRTFRRQPLDPEAADRGKQLFHAVGCVACHSPRDESGAETLARDSVPLGKLQRKYNLDGLVSFLENPHEARPSGRMPNMQLSHWEAVDVANYLLQGSEQDGPSDGEFKLDSALAERGRQRFDRMGCNQCHAQDEDSSPAHPAPLQPKLLTESDYPPLDPQRADEGCLSAKVGSWPRYDLEDSQRGAIQEAIGQAPIPLTIRQQITLTLATLNCIACHQRDGIGGVASERDEYFQTTNPNLGPHGRIPPTLTGVGAKLRPKWMRQVLVSGRTIRPYLKTRMPQYGADNVAHLVDRFRQADQPPAVELATFSDQKEARQAGHQLVGTAGLNCIACHNFQQKAAPTMPAVDLTEMAERLHQRWFYDYLRDPQRLSAGTVMPSFWPGGRAIRKDILGGDTAEQMEAIWQYLLDGRQARPPRGLTRKPIELLATDEAVMLRRSYPGIGKRGIGVGYPGQVNLAFDAEQLRLAMIWKGKFADPAGVWRSQGHGRVRPLGHSRVQFGPGPELDDATNPWVVSEGRPPRHQFKGYTLDELQRPTFRYRFASIDVEDYFVDFKSELSGDWILCRTLTFESDQRRSSAVFRVATAPDIQPAGDGNFRIGGNLEVHVDDAHDGQIVDVAAGKQLQIPLTIGSEQTTLVLQYNW